MSLIGCHVNDGQSIFVCKSDSNTQAIYFVFLKGKNETLSIRAGLQKANKGYKRRKTVDVKAVQF